MRCVFGFSMKAIQHKAFWVVFIIVLTVHLYNVGTQRLYPFLDMPNHLALASIYKSYGEPDNQLDTFFSLKMFPRPNVFHTVFCGSQLFPDVEIANKIFYLLYSILFAATVMLLIVRCRGNVWYGLLAFLFLYNINVSYGLIGFTSALPAILFLLYLTINYIEKRSILAAGAIAVLLPCIFFMHAMAFLFAVMVFLACVFFDMYRRGLWQRIFACLALCIPGLILFCVWYIGDSRAYNGPSIIASLLHYYQHTFLGSFWQRGAIMIHDNFRLSGTAWGYAFAALVSCVTILYAIMPAWKKRERRNVAGTTGFSCIGVFLVCGIICALLIPESLPGYSFLYQRFSVLIFLGIVLAGSIVAPPILSAPLKAFLCLVVVLHAVLWFQCFRAFDAENEGFNASIFADCSSEDVVGGLIYDYRFRNVSMYDNCPDYYTAWTQGVSTTRLADDRSFVIRRRVGTDILPKYIGWLGKGGSKQYDGRYNKLDYLLVRGEIPVNVREMMKNFTVVNQRGAWLLYANREQGHAASLPGK
jgi:hypothetical protein